MTICSQVWCVSLSYISYTIHVLCDTLYACRGIYLYICIVSVHILLISYYHHIISHLVGSIPDILCAMPNLQHLNLSSNQLSGYIVEDLGDLTNLITLELQNNKFSGYIPYSIRGLVKVQMINLSQNQLCGAVPDCLDQLVELRELYAYENKLSGKLL